MSEKNAGKTAGFEKQLWDSACVLWGSIPAADYRKVIVGLIFLPTSPQRSSRWTGGQSYERDSE